jgi:hypothetical protein
LDGGGGEKDEELGRRMRWIDIGIDIEGWFSRRRFFWGGGI